MMGYANGLFYFTALPGLLGGHAKADDLYPCKWW